MFVEAEIEGEETKQSKLRTVEGKDRPLNTKQEVLQDYCILTNPAHHRGENLKIFGLLGVEEGERTQHESEDALQEETKQKS